MNCRKVFFDELHRLMDINPEIFLLTGDLGFGNMDDIKVDYPKRFINCGAAEQTMLDMAVGLSQMGKLPVVYSITTFLLYRPFETIRNYVDHERARMILVGSGRGKDYDIDGFSHWCEDEKKIVNLFQNIWTERPNNERETVEALHICMKRFTPSYINLRR